MFDDDNFPPFPAGKSAEVLIDYLEGLVNSYRYHTTRPWQLIALAGALDMQGRGLDAAEARAEAGLLHVRYHWRHVPTGFTTSRTFTDRRSAWAYLSQNSVTKNVRTLVAQGKDVSDVVVKIRGYRLMDAVGSPAANIEARLADMALEVKILSGYVARVASPAATGGGYLGWRTRKGQPIGVLV